MDTAVRATAERPHPHLRPADAAQTLSVTVTYDLSEAGRKASLLSGGDGRGRQQFTTPVAISRLHLVDVDTAGVARLKLRPRFELGANERVVRHDAFPTYDAPPTVEDLFRDAARNHELERLFQAQRNTWRSRRREADQDRRSQAAREFLSSPEQRAMVHPAPSPSRCFLATPNGRVMFDVTSDVGPAREVPAEAHRRFRVDLAARRQRNLTQRADQLALHEQKTAAAREWIALRGSAEQQARSAAGVLPLDEVIAAMTDEAFQAVAELPRYEMDGSERLQGHLRDTLGDPNVIVAPADLMVKSADASGATAGQWAVIKRLQSALPDATVKLREHRLSSRRYERPHELVIFGALATRRVGPFNLRREFAVPGR